MALRNNIGLCFLLVILAECRMFAAADIPAVSKGDIKFYLDNCFFKTSSDSLLSEFYLMTFADQLQVNNEKSAREFHVKADIFNKSNSLVGSRQWTTEASGEGDSASVTKVIYDQWSEKLPAGEYTVKVILKDENSSKQGEAEYSFELKQTTSSGLAVSPVQFSVNVIDNKPGTQFSKGNKAVYPNPSRRFGVLNPVMYLYYELYNIKNGTAGSLKINYTVVNQSSAVVKKFPVAWQDKSSSSAAVIHGLNVGNIPSGIYNLVITVEDSATGVSAVQQRSFEIIQKDFASLKPAVSEEDAKSFENILSIIGTPQEVDIYSQLIPEGKAGFIVQYWKNADPTPGTPENQYFDKIMQRYHYANNNFSWGDIDGWKTERGRVLIKYGMPEQIDRHYSEASTVPYEVWNYIQEKNFYFVFADLRSDGRFTLLHSNKEGEIYNSQWQAYIKKM